MGCIECRFAIIAYELAQCSIHVGKRFAARIGALDNSAKIQCKAAWMHHQLRLSMPEMHLRYVSYRMVTSTFKGNQERVLHATVGGNEVDVTPTLEETLKAFIADEIRQAICFGRIPSEIWRRRDHVFHAKFHKLTMKRTFYRSPRRNHHPA
ncbi:Uncharacterized protein BM_BM17915 [Brugia malayi]|uniref:Uncharacterized protein n=1 Tax=Brugia malayi TaxID=6279 RepID=A0A4E9ES73_BRUMA|nr:Uncharacterized protein BM_BM17915 [Brugia malayi]VIO86433.1 Uncharacterized protein BM_BM17915 [Brugia malayi]